MRSNSSGVNLSRGVSRKGAKKREVRKDSLRTSRLFAPLRETHLPVMVPQVLEAFSGISLQTFIDGTLGMGGHAKALLQAHPEIETYLAIDQDPCALEIARKQLERWGQKVAFFHDNFSSIDTYLSSIGKEKAQGILLDIGVSSLQLDQPERGFSFRENGPLDMRMNPQEQLTAEQVVNRWSERELGKIFREYGEEKRWRAAAKAIVNARKKKRIRTTQELVEVLQSVLSVPPSYRKRRQKIHPMTLVFQALRICVNRELEVLEIVLPKAISLLAPKGRLCVISFHSLEDRIVKNVFRTAARGGDTLNKRAWVRILTKKPLCPDKEEMQENPRARSAKMRIIEKI